MAGATEEVFVEFLADDTKNFVADFQTNCLVVGVYIFNIIFYFQIHILLFTCFWLIIRKQIGSSTAPLQHRFYAITDLGRFMDLSTIFATRWAPVAATAARRSRVQPTSGNVSLKLLTTGDINNRRSCHFRSRDRFQFKKFANHIFVLISLRNVGTRCCVNTPFNHAPLKTITYVVMFILNLFAQLRITYIIFML